MFCAEVAHIHSPVWQCPCLACGDGYVMPSCFVTACACQLSSACLPERYLYTQVWAYFLQRVSYSGASVEAYHPICSRVAWRRKKKAVILIVWRILIIMILSMSSKLTMSRWNSVIRCLAVVLLCYPWKTSLKTFAVDLKGNGSLSLLPT